MQYEIEMMERVKKDYIKPFIIVEAFVPQQFCAGCDEPGNYKLNAPTIENDKKQGLNTSGLYKDDAMGGDYWMYCDSYEKDYILADTYTTDDIQNYHQYTLKSQGILVKIKNKKVVERKIYPINTIMYRQNSDTMQSAGNNRS